MSRRDFYREMEPNYDSAQVTLYKVKDNQGFSYLTKEEVLEAGFTNNELFLFPMIKYYKSLFGKNEVIFYNDLKSIWFETMEENVKLQFNYHDSIVEKKYIWEVNNFLDVDTHLTESRKRIFPKNQVFGLVHKDNNILLIKKSGYFIWQFPGGEVESSQKVESCELMIKKLTGLNAKIERIVMEHTIAGTDKSITYYALKYLDGIFHTDDKDVLEAEFFSLNDLGKYIGEINPSINSYLKKYQTR